MSRLRLFISQIRERVRFRKSGTVRTMFSFSVLGVALLLGAAAITSTEVSYIRLESSKATVEAGQRFFLDVYAYAHVPVNAVDVTLSFEADAVKAISVDKGQSVLTIWTEEPNIQSDKVTLRGGTFRKGFLGEHKIATIELEAKQSGQSEFVANNVLLLAGDGKGTPVKVAKADGSTLNLYVYDENTNPENIGVDVAVKIMTDINGDGKVGLQDISSFMSAWSSQSKVYDFNGDNKMSFKDFSIILSDAILGG